MQSTSRRRLGPPQSRNGHWFGTDANGRDLLVRVWGGPHLAAGRIAATLVSVVIGVLWGTTAGYLGGRTDG